MERETKHHLAPKARYVHHRPMMSRLRRPLIKCSALRGREKPRPDITIGVSAVEGPRKGKLHLTSDGASHNRRPLSTALSRKGSSPWSFMFVGAFVRTARAAKSSTSASTATAGKYAVARCVGIATGGLNAMRPTGVTKARRKAGRLILSVNKPTGNVSCWPEPIPYGRK